jgi:hypothetical protein
MNVRIALSAAVLATAGFLSGCSSQSEKKDGSPAAESAKEQKREAAIKAALDKLSPEDRKLAEEQRWCAVEPENRLGGMGMPLKVTINDQPVFLCCKSCKTEALAHPEKTIADVNELKAKAKAELSKK